MNGIVFTAESGTTSSLSTVFDALGDVFDLATKCFDYIIENPVLGFFFAAGIVPVGIGIFASLKNAAKS